MKKVLHVITDLDVGGAETFLFRLIPSLEERGFRSFVVYLAGSGKLVSKYRDCGIEVYPLDLDSGLRSVIQFLKLFFIVRSIRPDIIQTWMYHSDLVGGIVARLMNIPVIWGVRQSNLEGSVNSNRTLLVIRICALLSRYVPQEIVYNSVAAEKSHTSIGYDDSKSRVIPNGIDCDKFRPGAGARQKIRSELHIPEQSLVLGHIARYDVQKDHATFVKSIIMIREKHPAAHFVLAGDGIDWSNNELVGDFDYVKDHDWLHLLGFRSDISDVLSSMDIFCSSSRGESCPNAVIEAMAMGLPCIATDVGDVGSLLGEVGVIVDRQDPGQLADACILMLLESSDYRSSMGNEARRRVCNEFPLSGAAQSFSGLYWRYVGTPGTQGAGY